MRKDNQNKYNKKRAKILLKGIFPSFIGIFLPKVKKRIIFNSTRNEFYNFNTKYLFEYFIKYHPEYESKYVINEQEKRDILNKEFGKENNYFIETESLKGMWYALRAKTWVTSAFETPVGGIFLKFNRFVYLLGHGTHFKAIVFNEKSLSLLKVIYYYIIKYNFSYFLTTSKVLIPTYRDAYKCSTEQLIVLGEPRSDRLFSPNTQKLKDFFGSNVLKDNNVLYAPTWRKDTDIQLFPFDDMDWSDFDQFLNKHNINIFLRLHPSYENSLSTYLEKSKRIKILDMKVVEEISDILGVFDLLITDYSSIHISFLLLDKPVMFLPYDFELYSDQVGFIGDYDELTPGPKPDSMKSFQNELRLLLKDDNYYKEEREKASGFFNDYHYDNCKMNVKFIVEKIEGGKI